MCCHISSLKFYIYVVVVLVFGEAAVLVKEILGKKKHSHKLWIVHLAVQAALVISRLE